MREFAGITIPQSLDEIITPQNTALIVYDMQVGVAKQIKNGQEITQKVSRLVTACRAAGVRTFFTRHMSLPKELMGAFQYRTAMAWQRVDSPDQIKPMFLRDSPAFQIVPELAPAASEAVVDKIAMSAFEGTFLEIHCAIVVFAASLSRASRRKSESIRPAAKVQTLVSGQSW